MCVDKKGGFFSCVLAALPFSQGLTGNRQSIQNRQLVRELSFFLLNQLDINGRQNGRQNGLQNGINELYKDGKEVEKEAYKEGDGAYPLNLQQSSYKTS